MNSRDIDWKAIQNALIIFFVSMIIAITLVATSWYYKSNMLSQYQKSKRAFQNISQQYLAVDEEERLISQYYPKFVDFYNKGIIGPERRLNWIETLRASGERIKLQDLRYVINSQSEYEPAFPVDRGSFQIYQSAMMLNIDLLHEGDLVNLLQDLNRHALGLYTISRCNLKRRSEKIEEESINKTNIGAECELLWFNIKKSDGSVINLS